MKDQKNRKLMEKYNAVYHNGSQNFFTTTGFAESKLIVELKDNWNGLEVLEIGCGEGNLAFMLNYAGARRIDALDYSEESIEIAKNRFNFENIVIICDDFKNIKKKYDVVVLQGVLEHFDNSFEALKHILDTNVKSDGCAIFTLPSFLNPRGYVWMTLQLLFDVPMSLTDLNFICPFDVEEFCKENKYTVEIRSTEHDWGSGNLAIIDLQKRLTNALRDANMDNKNVDKLLAWLNIANRYFVRDNFSGAIAGYKVTKN